jgi:plastocyanin
MRVASIAVSVLLAAVLLAGCSSSNTGSNGGPSSTGANGGLTTNPNPSGGGQDLMVSLVDNRFVDGNKTIPAGSSIMYMNDGSHGHTVTIHWVGEPATVTRLNQTLQPGQDVTFTFDQAGTYHVWCRFHGQMTSGMASVVTVT